MTFLGKYPIPNPYGLKKADLTTTSSLRNSKSILAGLVFSIGVQITLALLAGARKPPPALSSITFQPCLDPYGTAFNVMLTIPLLYDEVSPVIGVGKSLGEKSLIGYTAFFT
ncbi:MAG: hypothetical protein IBX57_00895 [Gammaproteobacteria bacterium]|nr:hypothetical protein [Gammaproteobacteria bacterium]